MQLSEVFTQLASSELAQTNYVDTTTGLILPTKYVPLVSHVNLGLVALYKRFPLKENRVTIALQAGRLTYPINTQEDVEMTVEAGAEDFDDDILKIEHVYTDAGYEVSLNDAADMYSCMTPSMSTLRVPIELASKLPDTPEYLLTDSLEVVYRAKHPVISITNNFNPAKVTVELPYSHLEPLIWFIASRIHNPIEMTSINARVHTANTYAIKYEQACQQLELVNLRVDQGSQNNRLHSNGWV